MNNYICGLVPWWARGGGRYWICEETDLNDVHYIDNRDVFSMFIPRERADFYVMDIIHDRISVTRNSVLYDGLVVFPKRLKSVNFPGDCLFPCGGIWVVYVDTLDGLTGFMFLSAGTYNLIGGYSKQFPYSINDKDLASILIRLSPYINFNTV